MNMILISIFDCIIHVYVYDSYDNVVILYIFTGIIDVEMLDMDFRWNRYYGIYKCIQPLI